jgi:hypothetical protein
MSPVPLVSIFSTYLEIGCVPAMRDSQPHWPAAGRVAADCAVSVMLVRQADEARMT